MIWLQRSGFEPTLHGLLPFAFLGGFALVGLLELITGVSFTQWAGKWDRLKGWQRGVLGTLIVIVAGAIIILLVVLVSLLDR